MMRARESMTLDPARLAATTVEGQAPPRERKIPDASPEEPAALFGGRPQPTSSMPTPVAAESRPERANRLIRLCPEFGEPGHPRASGGVQYNQEWTVFIVVTLPSCALRASCRPAEDGARRDRR
jgi:hypothetical protein